MPVIANASLFLGKELEFVERGYIEIENGIIKSAGAGDYGGRGKQLDARGFLIMPGFVNAHTHIADSIGKDVAASSGLDGRVHPVFGAKKKILERSRPEHLKAFIRSSAISMLKKGIVAFADFREGGPEGVKLLREAINGLPIKCVALGRVDYYSSPKEAGGLPEEAVAKAKQVLKVADGLGISGANENTDASLAQYGQLKDGKLVAIHAAESKETVEFSKAQTGRSEVDRIMEHLNPDVLVHMTHATDSELELAATNNTGIVVCPRANGVLGAGIPRVAKMLEAGCLVAIGTDNVMLNSPDITRELDYIWKASRAGEKQMVEPRELLKMVTVNAAHMLRLNSGCIEQGRSADLIFVDKKHADLYPMHDPYAAAVHRLSQSSIRSVMVGGRFTEMLT
jgi:cytosine/adenosine deaminase-related metal-dependent hydrolase